MKLRRYAINMAAGDPGALACVSSTVSPWAGFGAAIPATRGTAVKRHTGNGVVRPKGLSEGSTV